MTPVALLPDGDGTLFAFAFREATSFGGTTFTPRGVGPSIVLARLNAQDDIVWATQFDAVGGVLPTGFGSIAVTTSPGGRIFAVADVRNNDLRVGNAVLPMPRGGASSVVVIELSRTTGEPIWEMPLRATGGMGAFVAPGGVAAISGGAIAVVGELLGSVEASGVGIGAADWTRGAFITELSP